MLKVLACDEGGSITCALLKVVEQLGREPDAFQIWANIAIPALTALASFAVLWFSVRTARNAEKQAERSEAARLASERRRDEDDRQRRLTFALAEFVAEVPRHVDDLRVFEQDLREFESPRRLPDGSPRVHPTAPSISQLLVRVDVAGMHALPGEMPFLSDLKKIVEKFAGMDLDTRRFRLRLLPSLIGDWSRGNSRSKYMVAICLGRLSRSRTMSQVRSVQRQYEKVRIMPPPPTKAPQSR